MRLIDVDALPPTYCVAWDNPEHMIINAPTVDAVPIIHAHWISLTDCSNTGVYCSHCHKKVYKEDYAPYSRKNKIRSNYCPNCGAKCDEPEENY